MISRTAESHRRQRGSRRLARLLSGVDLAIDLATLGEYGLEQAQPLPAEAPCRMRRSTLTSAWEALPAQRGRRGSCGHPVQLRAAIRRFS